ncbi:phosphatidylinositol 3-kinase regulatory subunit gamma-like [Orbicella faveolata]|uniref:phosphatidylinositol 3-kinase regulatory subunit gamma-like n=1 Tax=Orbicella faveolata TaxID=48498 RepID=UPI0009E29E9C|nr:phosphatidylinositol 3-kinase regulatory subunit gamma-like [Orbicella faveolata]
MVIEYFVLILCYRPDIDLSEPQWLRGILYRTEAEALLKNKVDGTFMIRKSNSRPGNWAVSLKHRGCVKHILVERGPEGFFGLSVKCTTYPTLVDLVRHYHENTLQVHNPELDTTLKFPLGSFVG